MLMQCILSKNDGFVFVCVKNLLMEYDKQGELLDSEKGRANNLERQIDDLTRQLQVSSQQVSSVYMSDLLLITVEFFLPIVLKFYSSDCYYIMHFG